ncbi:MAG: hypothetical protein JW750_04050 [Anaerolineaceae bacterium]|nr:hypothetical protein [Anaerolineaceae bacterium]
MNLAARQRAEEILLGNGMELGLMGAHQAYQQVWARESMLCGLGLWLTQSPEGPAIHQRSLSTLRAYQSELGKIPHNVGYVNVPDPALIAHGGQLDGGEGGNTPIEDSIHAGCVDSNLFYIIGFYYDWIMRGDRAELERSWDCLKKALLWLRYQDSNECGLLEVHEAMDWADLFANRYNVLFDNVLYHAAWKCMAQMARALGDDPTPYERGAEDVRRKVNILLWVGHESPTDYDWIRRERKEWLYPRQRVEAELVERPFYLPYMGFRDYADRFDTLGNLFAILFGVADETKANKILDYIHGCGLNDPYPVRALYPPIHPGEKDWREYYRVRNLNLPDHYHNGGAWPFIGGIYVAALVQAGRFAEAETQFESLTRMVSQGRQEEWEFNEWFHGISGRPMGFGRQSWSAGMYLFAADAVENRQVRVFNGNHGW